MFKGGIPEKAELLLEVTRMAMIKIFSKGNGKIWTVLCQGEGGKVEMENLKLVQRMELPGRPRRKMGDVVG